MERTLTLDKKSGLRSILIDSAAIMAIYFTPALSHLFSFPVYLLEPMRIMLIIAIAHTHRKNAYVIAVTLPLFSWLVSAHPHILKAGLIGGELLLNVFLFFLFTGIMKNRFASMLLAILASKLAYYGGKLALLNFGLLGENQTLIATPIYLQLIVMVVLSGYIFFFFRKEEEQTG
jgi:hypothetical protein